jgi:hypothetical protein
MVDIQTISIVFSGLSISLAAFYYIIEIRNAQKTRQLSLKAQEQALDTRQAQLFMQVFDKFHDPDFFNKFTQVVTWKWTNYDDFITKYGWQSNPEAWYSEGSVAAYFEGVGLLVYLQLLDVTLVHGLLFRHVKMFWEKISPISMEMRKRLRLPHIDQWLEYLYTNLMKKEMEIMSSGP